MSRFLHAVMLTVMLLHSILGCCWHHGHTHASEACQRGSDGNHTSRNGIASLHSHAHHHACTHHHLPVPVPADHDQEPHHHPCDLDNCHFMMAKAWEFPQHLELSHALVVVTRADAPMVLSSRYARQNADPAFEAAGLRCAVLQVWRI